MYESDWRQQAYVTCNFKTAGVQICGRFTTSQGKSGMPRVLVITPEKEDKGSDVTALVKLVWKNSYSSEKSTVISM